MAHLTIRNAILVKCNRYENSKTTPHRVYFQLMDIETQGELKASSDVISEQHAKQLLGKPVQISGDVQTGISNDRESGKQSLWVRFLTLDIKPVEASTGAASPTQK
jgi:hypothetical protein